MIRQVHQSYHVRYLPKLADAKYFCILIATSGYCNLKLDKKSSYLTTFYANLGVLDFLRHASVLFPISAAAESLSLKS